VWVWPGNTNDQTVVEEVKADLTGWQLGRAVYVMDTGFNSKENLRALRSTGGHYIAGCKLRSGMAETQIALSRQGRYQAIKENLRVKDIRVGDGEAATRYVVCHNPAEAQLQRDRRDGHIKRIEAELQRLAAQRERASGKSERQAHHRGECALRDHRTLGRYLRQTKTGRLVLDRASITAEERLDGKYLLTTSDTSLSAEDVALGYRKLLEAERSFRDLKGILLLRPVYHRREDRIRAHVLVCFLALILVRVSEQRTAQTWRQLRPQLGEIRNGHFAGPDGTFTQTAELTATQRGLLRELGVSEPSRITTVTPAST
jgi:transposase